MAGEQPIFSAWFDLGQDATLYVANEGTRTEIYALDLDD